MKWVIRFLPLLCFLLLSKYSYHYTNPHLNMDGLVSATRVTRSHASKDSDKLRATEVDDDDDDQSFSSKKGPNISNYYISFIYSDRYSGYSKSFSSSYPASSFCFCYSSLDKYLVNRVLRT